MHVFNIVNKTANKAIITSVNNKDFAIIAKSKRFIFDWNKLKGKQVYKLTQKGSSEILGLMCLVDHAAGWDAIEIKLIESSEENVGANKKIDRIAGCMIAYACRESVKLGHQGCIFLIPKTDLVQYYCEQYGFEPFGVSLVSETANSLKLMKKYL